MEAGRSAVAKQKWSEIGLEGRPGQNPKPSKKGGVRGHPRLPLVGPGQEPEKPTKLHFVVDRGSPLMEAATIRSGWDSATFLTAPFGHDSVLGVRGRRRDLRRDIAEPAEVLFEARARSRAARS